MLAVHLCLCWTESVEESAGVAGIWRDSSRMVLDNVSVLDGKVRREVREMAEFVGGSGGIGGGVEGFWRLLLICM